MARSEHGPVGTAWCAIGFVGCIVSLGCGESFARQPVSGEPEPSAQPLAPAVATRTSLGLTREQIATADRIEIGDPQGTAVVLELQSKTEGGPEAQARWVGPDGCVAVASQVRQLLELLPKLSAATGPSNDSRQAQASAQGSKLFARPLTLRVARGSTTLLALDVGAATSAGYAARDPRDRKVFELRGMELGMARRLASGACGAADQEASELPAIVDLVWIERLAGQLAGNYERCEGQKGLGAENRATAGRSQRALDACKADNLQAAAYLRRCPALGDAVVQSAVLDPATRQLRVALDPGAAAHVADALLLMRGAVFMARDAQAGEQPADDAALRALAPCVSDAEHAGRQVVLHKTLSEAELLALPDSLRGGKPLAGGTVRLAYRLDAQDSELCGAASRTVRARVLDWQLLGSSGEVLWGPNSWPSQQGCDERARAFASRQGTGLQAASR